MKTQEKAREGMVQQSMLSPVAVLKKLRQLLQLILKAPQQVISYIAGAVSRIFGPNDDQYPATGVQPFEGEIEHQKKARRH
jgi:hypothetical protein